MFVTNGPNAIEHEDANCHCSCCKQLPKPAKIIILPCALFRQRATLINKTDLAGTAGIPTANYRGNVISISAAIKPAEQTRAGKAGQAKFNYPMLECT